MFKNVVLVTIIGMVSLSSCIFQAQEIPSVQPTSTHKADAVLLSMPGDFGDSKLVTLAGNLIIISTLDGYLQYRTFDTSFAKTKPEISANWESIIPSTNNSIIAIVGSFQDKRIRIYRISISDGTAQLLSVIANDQYLKIDPAIISTPFGYFATYTRIIGNVNNSDPTKENGEYTVFMYQSNNLIMWKYVATIVQAKRNIEDGRLLFNPSHVQFYFIFEEEIIDQGHSSVKVAISDDHGTHWTSDTVLLDARADQEPGAFFQEGDHFALYYSSDIDNGGIGSYEHGKLKKAVFDPAFHDIQRDLNVAPSSAALLLDTVKINNYTYLLFIEHYLTKEKRLVVYQTEET